MDYRDFDEEERKLERRENRKNVILCITALTLLIGGAVWGQYAGCV